MSVLTLKRCWLQVVCSAIQLQMLQLAARYQRLLHQVAAAKRTTLAPA